MRIKQFFAYLIVCFICSQASAQSKFSMGFRLGANLTNPDFPGWLATPLAGLVGGVKFNYSLGENTHIKNLLSFEILFDQISIAVSREVLGEGRFQKQNLNIISSYIDFPILFELSPKLLQGHIGNGTISFVGSSGVMAKVRLSNSGVSSVSDTLNRGPDTRIILRPFDFGIALKIGGVYEWGNGTALFVDFGSELGLININSDPSNPLHSSVAHFTAGMMFPL